MPSYQRCFSEEEKKKKKDPNIIQPYLRLDTLPRYPPIEPQHCHENQHHICGCAAAASPSQYTTENPKDAPRINFSNSHTEWATSVLISWL